MTIDERIEALTMNLELLTRDVQALTEQTKTGFAQTLEFINRLAHVAEAHEQRLDDLEKR